MMDRIILEPNLTDEQIVKLYHHYKNDSTKMKNLKLFELAKQFWRMNSSEIMKAPENIQSRKTIRIGD